MKPFNYQCGQQGVMLMEALIAILIFSVGILGIVGLQAATIRHSADAKYRADASLLANQILGQMWADQGPPDQRNLPSYAHNSTAGEAPCNPGGSASSNVNVEKWLAAVSAALPNATAAKQQIAVGPNDMVTVTICWKGPQDSKDSRYVATAQINN